MAIREKKVNHNRLTGITGGIGSGKSVVCRILRLNGYPVYDCDSEARRLMETEEEVIESLTDLLGKDIYLSGNRLDRKLMADILFADKRLLDEVNMIVHSAVRRDLLKYVERQTDRHVFCESAILASSGIAEYCTDVWLVDAPTEVRIARVEQRSRLSADEIFRRMKAQEKEFNILTGLEVMHIHNDGTSAILPQISLYIHDIEYFRSNTYIKDIKTTEILCSEKF